MTTNPAAVRPAKKAGTWYKASPESLSRELDRNLEGVHPSALGCDSLPIPGARIIIAPHAGYEYSGECAAWAYRCLDLSKARRVFILGPSHVIHLSSCAVTQYSHFATPFGPLAVDRATIDEIRSRAGMSGMDPRADAREHSLELHLPYLYRRLQQTFGSAAEFPTIVPIVVGSLGRHDEKTTGRALAPYVRDPSNAFIVSSDFCHWGDTFGFSPYSAVGTVGTLRSLQGSDGPAAGARSVEDTIELIDRHALDAIRSGIHDNFRDSLKLTGNTVCGRHPIGVMMAALEVLAKEDEEQEENQDSDGPTGGRYRFREVKYTTSGRVKNDGPIGDAYGHSVSYVSAYAVP